MIVLGIETSCDETAAAVVFDGSQILSSVISSQAELHKPYGGVVPEIASREHLEKIEPVVNEALLKAKVSLKEIDAIAVTQGPGLVGSLLVGVCFAKSLAFAINKPFIGVNHIEGHIFSVVFDNPPVQYPALALIVSGGHTNLFFIPEAGKYKLVARTRDDAAGEAFDKVAKMLGLGYPGGPIIEKIAKEGNPKKIKFPIPKITDGKPDFSFSGLKTAVSRYIRQEGVEPAKDGSVNQQIKDLCASFQLTAIRSLILPMEKLARELKPKTLIVAGGVACNMLLRTEAAKVAEKLKVPVYFPSRHLSTDNAAMIAAAGTFHLKRGEKSDLLMTADPMMRLQNIEVDDEKLRKKVRYRL
ncbi:MAG: tRNA (adenosine(37)-N6)-threonylcarbamoyltransferase complex transferase subunit TsaD [Pyrinomonadaceae bacterium]|nr:tRNA (adenosine(37)-N6)-threonylcarbamoyltransferase complex transferase subunit TsaD [Pyrinomonadaceae bacterium]MCX7640421.1 tRNA (adenosine(37)-N6)-threonylcarbamoyltransferase complex transferase subunit TsaD [Pyrinomonadaceae bacterium]MDW8304848.1 tRNA (adenosine(37)-N6)-threonylcarbamoyltransferase complex transferase subunit TsaD [Acidobacteriota bacterium]